MATSRFASMSTYRNIFIFAHRVTTIVSDPRQHILGNAAEPLRQFSDKAWVALTFPYRIYSQIVLTLYSCALGWLIFFWKTVRSFDPYALVEAMHWRAYQVIAFVLAPIFRLRFPVHAPHEPRNYVVVLGADTAVGREVTARLACDGWNVLAAQRSPKLHLQGLDTSTQGRIRPVSLDSRSDASIKQFSETVYEILGQDGRLVALAVCDFVHHASYVAGPIEVIPGDVLLGVFDATVVGLTAVLGQLLPLVRKSSGRLTFVSSAASLTAAPGNVAAASTFRVLDCIADTLRVELIRFRCPVSLIVAGSVQSTSSLSKHKLDFPQQYKSLGEAYAAVLQNSTQLHPRYIAQAVSHSFKAKAPLSRYYIGWDAKLTYYLRCLPDPLLDLGFCLLMKSS